MSLENLPASTRKLGPQDWLGEEPVKRVMAALNTDEGASLFVGGCVRNALLNIAVEDIDIATQFAPDVAALKLTAAGFTVIPTGIDHGTITALLPGGDRQFEITTLRRDVSTDGRRATVAYSHDWAEDAARRDFTMNTLLADSEGNVYDPLGSGIADLAARKVRFVGKAAERVAEDHLRILRYFRFHGGYGSGDPDKAALKACREAADKIGDLSRERITQEIFKILVGDNAPDILELMFKNNILREFFHSQDHNDFFRHFCEFQSRYGLISLNSRLFVFLGLKKEIHAMGKKFFLFPKVFLRDFENLHDVLAGPDLSDDQSVRRAVYTSGRTITAQALMIELAQDRVMNGYAPKALEIIQNWDVPDFPLTGNDLIERGIKPGPDMGKILAEIENWWIAEDFKPDRKACLARITQNS